jgi:peptide subunit release factor RF-3
LFLDKLFEMGARPLGREYMAENGDLAISAEYDEFTGFNLKSQANLDP